MFDQIIPKEMYAGVQDFMRIMQTSRDFYWWATTLVTEETKELNQAVNDNEGMEQVFKESADLLYVVAGFYNCMPMAAPMILTDEQNAEVQGILEDAWNALAGASIQFEIPINLFGEAFAIVHMSNMSKLDENGEPVRREDGKILKGPNYQAPDMTPVVGHWQELMDKSKLQEAQTDADTNTD